MFVPSVKPYGYDDFFGEYYGAEGPPPGVDELPTLTTWFFPVPSAGVLILTLLVLRLGLIARLRPDLAGDQAFRSEACVVAITTPLWVLCTVVLYPGIDAPSFRRLAGTWISLGASLVAAAGLLALMRRMTVHEPA